MAQQIVFLVLSGLITLCSVLVVTSRNAVGAAVYLVLDLFLLAGVFAMLGAEFVAAIQVLVYAGAILVLFLFVIMLLNLSPSSLRGQKITAGEWLIFVVCLLGTIGVSGAILLGYGGTAATKIVNSEGGFERIRELGVTLFSQYVWPFELASLLILLAIIGCVVVSRKPKKSSK